MWVSLCQMLGLAQYEHLNEDQRSRRVNEIDPVLREAIAKWAVADLYVEFEKRGIAFGPVIEANDVLKEPQLVYRDIVAHGVGPKKQTFVRQPILFDDKNFPLERPAPELGEHSQEILAALAKAAA